MQLSSNINYFLYYFYVENPSNVKDIKELIQDKLSFTVKW